SWITICLRSRLPPARPGHPVSIGLDHTRESLRATAKKADCQKGPRGSRSLRLFDQHVHRAIRSILLVGKSAERTPHVAFAFRVAKIGINKGGEQLKAVEQRLVVRAEEKQAIERLAQNRKEVLAAWKIIFLTAR